MRIVANALVAIAVVALLTPAARADGIQGTIISQPEAPFSLRSCDLFADGTIFITSSSPRDAVAGITVLYLVRVTAHDGNGRTLFVQVLPIAPGALSTTPVARLFVGETGKASSLTCSIDSPAAYVSGNDKVTPYAGGIARTCGVPEEAVVDGGAAADFKALAFGPEGVELDLSAWINNFIPVGRDTFDRTPYFMSVDGARPVVTYVSGLDPQRLSLVRPALSPGLHHIRYGEGNADSEDTTSWTFCFVVPKNM